VTKTRAIHSSPIIPADASANARLVYILRPVTWAALSKSFPKGDAMLHLKPRFKVKEFFMRIGELSRRTGISTSRIRFYEKHALLPKPIRDRNGYRKYLGTAAKILELIDGAQQLGFSLSEIRAGLSEAAPNFPSRAAMVKALRGKLDHIDRHIQEVRARRRQIVKLLKEMRD
jgi:MerR family transcriptional regulator, copper efflux regulator